LGVIKLKRKLFLIIFSIFFVVVGCGIDEVNDVGKTTENTDIENIDAEIKSNIEEPKETLSEETISEIETKLLGDIIIIKDDIEKANWYYTKGSPGSKLDFAFYIYMGEKDEDQWLRLVTGFHRDSWIFFKKIKVLADDYVFEIPFDDYYEKTEEVKAGINEFIDVSVDEQLLNDLIKVGNAKNSKIRFIGKDHSKDYEINLSKKMKIQKMVDYFNFKQGNYEGLVERYKDKENNLYEPFVGYWKTSKIQSAFSPTDEGATLQNVEVYRSYDDSGNMIEVTIDTIGIRDYEMDYKVLSEREIENQTKDGNRFLNEEYSFESDKLIVYSYWKKERYIFQKISKEEFDKVLEKAK